MNVMPDFTKNLLPNPRPAAHGCNACQLPDGRVLVMWFAGTREGVEDQRVLMTLAGTDGVWSDPRVLVDHFDFAGDRWIVEIAAPLLYADDDLWVTFSASPLSSFSYREERNAYLRSLKHARLFQAKVDMSSFSMAPPQQLLGQERLILQGKNVKLADGSWVVQCNSYDEFDRHSATLVQGDPYNGWAKAIELKTDPGCLEPSTTQFSDGTVLCYLRYGDRGGHIWRSESTGLVTALSPCQQTTLRNPHSGIDIAADDNDDLVIAFNDNYRLRTPLTLGVSGDRGVTWRCRDIEIEEGEYSYPKLLKTGDGQWHVFYTHHRRRIALVSFNKTWLKAGRPVFGLEQAT